MQWERILSWTITRRQVSRDLWLLRPSPVITHCVAYQPKPSSELGTSLPSNVGQDGYEMSPKVLSDLWLQQAMSTTNWHLPRASSKTEQRRHLPSASGAWTPCCCSCWPSATPEGVQGGERHSVLQGIWWNRYLNSWMFLGTDFMISILASPHI